MENNNLNVELTNIENEYELLDIINSSYEENGCSCTLVAGNELIDFIFTELIKMDYEIGLVDFERDMYDDYDSLYMIAIDDDGNICLEKAYCTYSNSEYYGRPLKFDADTVLLYDPDIDRDYIDFVKDECCVSNIKIFEFDDDCSDDEIDDDFVDEFDEEKCLGCELYDECKAEHDSKDNSPEISLNVLSNKILNNEELTEYVNNIKGIIEDCCYTFEKFADIFGKRLF